LSLLSQREITGLRVIGR